MIDSPSRARAGRAPAPTAPAVIPEAAPARRRRVGRGYASGKDDYLVRLRKIEGQVRALQRMVEGDAWCPDIVIQVTSATRALQEVAVGVLNDHVRHCILGTGASAAGAAGEQLDELAAMIRQVMRR